jgi:hypothetical protein
MADVPEEIVPAGSVGVSSEELIEREKQLSLLTAKAWFFLDISYDQIELILKQREENAFVVTNGAFDTQYVIYMSIQSLTDELQLVKIDQIFQDGAFKYIAEGNVMSMC